MASLTFSIKDQFWPDYVNHHLSLSSFLILHNCIYNLISYTMVNGVHFDKTFKVKMWLTQQDGDDLLLHDTFVQRNAIFSFNTEGQRYVSYEMCHFYRSR